MDWKRQTIVYISSVDQNEFMNSVHAAYIGAKVYPSIDNLKLWRILKNMFGGFFQQFLF